VTALTLFNVFFLVGLSSFGGGITGWIYNETVERRGWLTHAEFLSALALCQILPGPNVVNLALYIGQKLRGLSGAVIAFAALIAPPFFYVIGFAVIYDWISGVPAFFSVVDGVTAAALGLLLSMAWKASRTAARSLHDIVAIVITVVLIGFLRWPLLPVICVIVPASVLVTWWRKRAHA
jgi:chromate transporter